MPYSEAYKRRMVQKMSGPNAMSAWSLAEKEGEACQATLSRWLREASKITSMKKPDKIEKKIEQSEKSQRRPQDWTLVEKLRVIVEAAELSPDGLGAFLRREGLHEPQLEQWRQEAREAFRSGRKRSPRNTAEKKRIKELERELRRKEKALAETAALLVLKKKALVIWGDEDDVMDRRNDR